MLNVMSRTIDTYSRAPNAPIWVYNRKSEDNISVDHYLTLDEAKHLRDALDQAIITEQVKADAKAEADREAADFAAFKAARAQAAADAEIAELVANVERAA